MKPVVKRNLILLIGVCMALAALMIYPFLPGRYDLLALPGSLIVQCGGILGLPLSLVAIIRTAMPRLAAPLDRVTVAVFGIASFMLAFFAFLIAGTGVAIGVVVFLGFLLRQLLRLLRRKSRKPMDALQPYLMIIPGFVVVFSLLMAPTLTRWSRHRTMTNATPLIEALETFKARHGHYPPSLQAIYHDYEPNTIGIEQYYYRASHEAYDVSFEQPRFLLDVPGTRERVVYNPSDQHRVFSHASWLLMLSPEEAETSPGWYASEALAQPHWKSFRFD